MSGVYVNGDLVTKTIGGVPNVVVAVPFYFEKAGQATDGSTKTVRVRNVCPLSYDPANPFIQYADLTEQQVVAWIVQTLDTAGQAYYENYADDHLALVTTQNDCPGTMFWVDCKQYEPDPEMPTPTPW